MISPTVSLDPASDVIADVIRAADPDRSAAVARRLSDIADLASAPIPSFDSELGRLATRTPLATSVQTTVVRAGARERVAADAKNGAQTAFESMFLGNVLGELLPTDAGGYFGEGTAGQMWKSLLADQVARQIAKSGALDIAGRLFARGARENDAASAPPAAVKNEMTPAWRQG